jgi:hypothetical protein
MRNIRLLIVVLLLQSFLFLACQPLSATITPEIINTKPISITPTVIPVTNTTKITFTATVAQEINNCTANDKLPDPDIPENYIGWMTGNNFSDLFEQENMDGNYMYQEALLPSDHNIVIAEYRRSDNSYMLFVKKFTCRDINNSRVYEIVAAGRTRKLNEGEYLAPLDFECFRYGENGEVELLFAIVNRASRKAMFAWSMNAEDNGIQETPLEGITCLPNGIIAPGK